MKNKILNIFCLTVTAVGLAACIGSGKNATVSYEDKNQFPIVTGIDLHGEEREIPTNLDGQYKIVTVAFERVHQDLVDTWIPFATQLEKRNPDVRFYEIPMIYEMSGVGRFWVNNGMRSGIQDSDARNRTITVYTQRDEFAQYMGVDMNTITTFLLDNDGRILWRQSGAMTDQAKTALLNKIDAIK